MQVVSVIKYHERNLRLFTLLLLFFCARYNEQFTIYNSPFTIYSVVQT